VTKRQATTVLCETEECGPRHYHQQGARDYSRRLRRGVHHVHL